MRLIVIAALVLGGAGCASQSGSDQPAQAESQRARDSTIGESNLPGAGGVRGAMRVADSSAARAARVDSASNP